MNRTDLQAHFAGRWNEFYSKYLPGLKALSGGEFQTKCPFHQDEKPSLNFSAETGKFFCHGCGAKGDSIHFYAKLHGLDTKRDFGKVLAGIASDFGLETEDRPKPRIIKVYDYVDADGTLLFQVCRMEPKDFRQRRPDGRGGWLWNTKGITPVLYRLPEVLKADEVLIVEGEKDADAVAALHFAVTTSPGGAKKWKDEYSDYLKDKNVILIPDNDLPGREHMARIGASLKGKAKSIKWLELPGLPSKGDFSDWLNGQPDPEAAAESLAVLIDKTGEYEPPKKATFEDMILTDREFLQADIPARRSLLEPWLRESSICLVSGWRGTGKTWFALSLLDAVTRGAAFGPWAASEPVPCLYLDGEMPAADIQERLNMLDSGDRPAPLYIYCDHLAVQQGLSRASLLSEAWRAKMTALLKARGVRLWVIDNLASLAPGLDENKRQDWDVVNQWLLELRFAGIATILLHHTGKGGQQRGTSAREDNLDCSIVLKAPLGGLPEDGAKFVCNFSKARVATKDLGKIADTLFHLRTDEAGRLAWTWGDVKRETKIELLRLFNEGYNQQDAADVLGISKGRASQLKKQAAAEGLLTTAGQLTQAGLKAVYEVQDAA